jgi:endonuclease YncB( thermonuclease family)
VHPLLGNKIGVRLAGIDSPELRSANKCEKDVALKAKARLKELLSKASRIDLLNADRDKYFRILADVVTDSVPVKDVLIKERLAVPYDGKTKTKVDWCAI